MSDKIWFFARGDTEHGPVTAKQIKALAETGKLRDDDLVWREGMPDWTLAAEVSEIFETESTATPDSTDLSDPSHDEGLHDPRLPSKSDASQAHPAPIDRPALSRKNKLSKLPSIRELGLGCIIGGVLLAFLARGCDMSHGRYAASLRTRVAYATATFENEWDAKKIQLEQRQQLLATQIAEDGNPLYRQQLLQVEEELANWSDDKSAARKQLQAGKWAHDRQAAGDATIGFQTLSFYRSLVFLLGALVLLGGLSAVSLRGIGPERWICLGMLAIALFSLFISGDAWTHLPAPPPVP